VSPQHDLISRERFSLFFLFAKLIAEHDSANVIPPLTIILCADDLKSVRLLWGNLRASDEYNEWCGMALKR